MWWARRTTVVGKVLFVVLLLGETLWARAGDPTVYDTVLYGRDSPGTQI